MGMKRSTFLAIAGVILVFFIVSAFGNRNRFYEKKETFDRPEEAIVNFIGYANKYEMVRNDNGYSYITSREFLESLSKRYRLYIGIDNGNNFISEQVPFLFSYDMQEVDYNSLINIKDIYENSFKNISSYNRDSNPRVYRLDGYGNYNGRSDENFYINEDGTVDNLYDFEEIPVTIYLVVVNEGEGYVIDYYSVVYQ
jgi:hypothetical protein